MCLQKKYFGEYYIVNFNIDSEIIIGNVFFLIIFNKNKFIYDFKCYILVLRVLMWKENFNVSYVLVSYIFFCYVIYLYIYMENIYV